MSQMVSRDLKVMDPEAQLRAILDNTQQSFVLIDPEYTIQAFNRTAAQNAQALLGRTMQPGQSFLDYVRPADREGFRQHFQRALAGDTITVEKAFPDDQWFAFIYNPIRADTDAVTGVCFNMVDITARKRAEAALQASLARYDDLVARIPVGIYVVWLRADGTMDFEYVSERWCEITQLTEEAVLADATVANALVHPDEREAFLARNWEAQHRLAPFSWEGRFVIGGDIRWLRVQSTPSVEDDGDIRWFGVTQDITERKRAEEAYRALVAHSLQGLCILQEGRVVFANPTLATMFGYTVEELLARSPEEASASLTSEGRDFIRRQNRARQAGEPVSNRYEIQVYTKDGDLRWTEQFVTAITYRGRPALQIAVVDITDRKRAEQALRRYAERLRNLHEIDAAILAARSAEDIARTALTRLRDMIAYQRASITEINGSQSHSRETVVLTDDGRGAQSPTSAWDADIGHLVGSLRRGRVHIVQDISLLEAPLPLERRLAGIGLRAYVTIPMVVRGTLIGTLNLASGMPHFFQPDHVEIAQEVAASLAVALQQARLLEQTRLDAETKALLLHEVNHRVKNNLEAIIGLLYVERRHAPPEVQAAFQPIVDDLTQRIMGLAQVHRMLSAAEWQPLVLSELTQQLIDAATQTVTRDVWVEVNVTPSPVRVSPAQAHHLALVISELTTNTLKYAVAERDTVWIGVRIAQEEDVIILTYRNDGPDYPEEVLRLERHNAGLDIVQNIVRRNLQGELALRNEDGAVAEIQFKLSE